MWYGQVEGTDIVVVDPRFKACFAAHVRVERLWTGARWAEGPAWFAAGRYLVWSDIPNNRMWRFVEPSGEVESARVVRGMGHGLDEAALGAARGFRFSPAMKAGRPVHVRMGWSVQFRLQ